MIDHDDAYHEDQCSDDDVNGDDSVSSDTSQESGDLFQDGLDLLTHGGGELEDVDGFDPSRAMVEGIGNTDVTHLAQDLLLLPTSCSLEFSQEQQESVCGEDDRRSVATVTIPWRMICQLIITRRDGIKSRCTGWFIAPRTVMTAGHCVYTHKGQRGWARSIEVVPGMNGRLRPFGSAIATTFHSVTGWTKHRRITQDYGCIILREGQPLGTKTGWWGFASLGDNSLRNLLANNSGYPGDKPFGTQWYNAGRITDVSKERFQYMLDTAGGQSGSPTWRSAKGKRHVIGIHAYGGCPNKSIRINKAVFRRMQAWRTLGQ